MKGNRLQVLVYSFIFFVLLSTAASSLNPTLAAESTPSADIKLKLEEFKKQAASKAAQLKDLIVKKMQNKAYVGTVESKSDSTLTLAVASAAKIVSINGDTVFVSNVKAKKINQKNISSGDLLAALGDVDETGVLIAKKIVLLPKPDPNPKTFLAGQIISVSDDLTILRDKDQKNIVAKLPKSKAKINDFVILTGSKDKNNIFQAKFIYITEEKPLKQKKIATPSARLAPQAERAKISTPSATPKPASR